MLRDLIYQQSCIVHHPVDVLLAQVAAFDLCNIQPSLDICCRISIEIRSGMGTNKICGELSLTLSKASWKILAIKMLQSYMRHFVDQGVKDILIFSWYFHDDNLLAFSTVCSVFPGTIEDCVPFHGFFRICK